MGYEFHFVKASIKCYNMYNSLTDSKDKKVSRQTRKKNVNSCGLQILLFYCFLFAQKILN